METTEFNKITKEVIAEVLGDNKQGMHVEEIATRLINKFSSNPLFDGKLELDKVKAKVNSILLADTKKKDGNGFVKMPKKGFYKNKPQPKEPKVKPPKQNLPSVFTGTAGECAVMSELLFRGYNVNSMLVDDGVDIVASKNNIFYYVQVKTTEVDSKNRIYAPTIKQNKFEQYIGTQMRYIVVARCIMNNIETNMYFVFDNGNIERFKHYGLLHHSDNGINIKIEIDSRDGKPYIYHDGKKEDIKYHLNNFSL